MLPIPALVEQDGFNRAALLRQFFPQACRREVRAEGFNAQIAEHGVGILRDPYASEFADIVENKAGSVREAENQPVVREQGVTGFCFKAQIPAHAQMNENERLIRCNDENLPAAVDGADDMVFEERGTFFRGAVKDQRVPIQ